MDSVDTPYSHYSHSQHFYSSPCRRQEAALWQQCELIITSGNDPNVFSTSSPHRPDFDPELHELERLKRSMDRMDAEYSCLETLAHIRCQESSGGLMTSQSGNLARNCYRTGLNTATTMEWLQAHYEEQSGISLPRGAMYGHYLDYCRQVALEPINQATFGKVIRTIFPGVKTRRLGTRGQSKYHYYGMGIKASSPYKEIMMSAQRVNNYFGEPTGKGIYSRTVAQTSLPQTPPGSQIEPLQGSVLLRDFPAVSNIRFPDDIKDTMAVFLMMYRHHSQRVIDTILRANLPDVKEFVVHFWQSLPAHINNVLRDDLVVRTVALCDKVLYQAIVTLLLPGPLHPLPNTLMVAIRTFGQDLITWLSDALKIHPEELRHKKLQVARRFSQRLWRQTSVSHIAAVTRSFLHSSDVSTKLPHDWAMLDIDVISKEVSHDLDLSPEARNDLQQYVEELEQLLNRPLTMEQYVDWIKVVFSQTIRRTMERSSSSDGGLQGAARTVLLQWVYVTKVFIRELTLLSADMFGPYHLMSLLSQDYVMYLTEDWKRQEAEHKLKASIYGDEETDFVPDWDTLLCVSPYVDHSTSTASLDDPYQFTPEKHNYSAGGQRQIFGYPNDLPESPLPNFGGDLKPDLNYAHLHRLPKPERCDFLRCHNNTAQFDEVEQTPPDDHSSSVLDLSNYSSSFADDDALVDKVISKGYATLDDCSQTISPLPWKPEGTHHSVTSSSTVRHHQRGGTPRMSRQVMTQVTSTSTSSATYHQLIPQQPPTSASSRINMVAGRGREAQTNMRNTEAYGQSLNASYNNNIQQVLQNQTTSPESFDSKNSSYSSYPGNYLDGGVTSRDLVVHQHSQPLGSSPSLTSYEKPERRAGTTSRSPHSFTLPEFTHISASLQMAALNPRKRWILEEEMRNEGIVPTTTRLAHMPQT